MTGQKKATNMTYTVPDVQGADVLRQTVTSNAVEEDTSEVMIKAEPDNNERIPESPAPDVSRPSTR
jgi:hypothetical protein